MDPSSIREAVESCRKCVVIDKPPCIYRVYEKFLPTSIETLVVSESPPPGRKEDYIYNLGSRDRLRSVLAYILGVREDSVPEKLLNHKIFWTTAVKCRPISKSMIESMRRNCVPILELEVVSLSPKRILALGTVAWKSIEELEVKVPVEKFYHPLYLARFRRGEFWKLKKLLLNS